MTYVSLSKLIHTEDDAKRAIIADEDSEKEFKMGVINSQCDFDHNPVEFKRRTL